MIYDMRSAIFHSTLWNLNYYSKLSEHLNKGSRLSLSSSRCLKAPSRCPGPGIEKLNFFNEKHLSTFLPGLLHPPCTTLSTEGQLVQFISGTSIYE